LTRVDKRFWFKSFKFNGLPVVACGLFNGTPIFLAAHSMLITLLNKHALFLSLVLTILLILMVFGLRSEFN